MYVSATFPHEISGADASILGDFNNLSMRQAGSTVDDSDLKIQSYLLLKNKLKLANVTFQETEEQSTVVERLINSILDFLPDLTCVTINSTNDNEILFARKLKNWNVNLVIDEFGGVAIAKIGKPGQGYEHNYFQFEQLTQDQIESVAKSFLSV